MEFRPGPSQALHGVSCAFRLLSNAWILFLLATIILLRGQREETSCSKRHLRMVLVNMSTVPFFFF